MNKPFMTYREERDSLIEQLAATQFQLKEAREALEDCAGADELESTK